MKIAMISFSRTGCQLSGLLSEALRAKLHEVRSAAKSRYLPDSLEESVKEWTGKRFEDSDAIVFIGACGIAVRSIAPFVRSKKLDPAVVVVDEQGKYSIPLLSGHIGRANELAEEIAELIQAQPVVTTATDLNGVFAVDVFSEKNGCTISDMSLAKEVSAALLTGKEIGFASDFPWRGEVPAGLKLCREGEERPELGICVTAGRKEPPFVHTLYLVPRVVTIGVGCRKDTPKEKIEALVYKAYKELSFFPASAEQVASIDLKKDESGIKAYCGERGLPFLTYTADELKEVKGSFSESGFVKTVTGIGNVCERAALLGSSEKGAGRLILKKQAQDGVTVALAMKEWSVEFE